MHSRTLSVHFTDTSNIPKIDQRPAKYIRIFIVKNNNNKKKKLMVDNNDPSIRKLREEREIADNDEFHKVCKMGEPASVKFMLKEGADVNKKDKKGLRPLHNACFCGRFKVAEILIDHGAGVDRQDTNGCTPLHKACVYEFVEVAKMLLDHGADVDRQDNNGSTPLHLACSGGNFEYVKIMIERGADVDRQDKNGSTPLHLACGLEVAEIVIMLIIFGCLPDTDVRSDWPVDIKKLVRRHRENPSKTRSQLMNLKPLAVLLLIGAANQEAPAFANHEFSLADSLKIIFDGLRDGKFSC